jgi:hypothetical protein
MAIDEQVRAMLKQLGTALNEAVSSSEKVHGLLDRLREEGYEPYLCLDAKVALDRSGRRAEAALPTIRRGAHGSGASSAPSPSRGAAAARKAKAATRATAAVSAAEAQEAAAAEGTFLIDRRDLGILQSLGIDPTRPVRSRRRPEAAVAIRSTVSRKH